MHDPQLCVAIFLTIVVGGWTVIFFTEDPDARPEGYLNDYD